MFRKASDGSMPIKATLLSEKQKGATSITVSNLTGWNKGKRQDFVICKYDTDNKIVPGSVTTWIGIPADNGTINQLELTGGNDQLYPIGSSVVASPTSRWADDLIDALLELHNADGSLKDKAVELTKLDGGATAGVLKTDASGNVTVGKMTADNIDSATFPMFRAVTTTSQSFANATFTTAVFQNKEYDTTNSFNNTVFTAPISGIYRFDAILALAVPQGARSIARFVIDDDNNKNRFFDGQPTSSAGAVISGSLELYLKAGQTVKVEAWKASGDGLTAGNSISCFSGRMVAGDIKK